MGQYEQRQVSEIIGKPGILYQPGLQPIFGLNAAILLSQLLYWHGKGNRKDGWFFKTIEEMKEETGLSRTQQESAIKHLKQHGVVSTKRKDIPAKRHFKVHMRKLQTCLQDFYKLESNKSAKHTARKQQPITKTTSQTTSKTNADKELENTVVPTAFVSLDDIPF